MPLILLLLAGGALGVGAGFLVARKSCDIYELQAKKAFDECVKALTTKAKLTPQQAAEVCKYQNPTLDLAKLSLLTATVVASLSIVKVLQSLLTKEGKNATTTSATKS